MSDSTLLELLIAWGPMLLLVAVWLFFMRRMGNTKGFQGLYLEEIRRQNQLLERIATAIEKR